MLSNTRGGRILSTSVTKDNFAGPPLILIGDSLTSTSDTRWTAYSTFADRFSAPLIGLDYVADATNLGELDRCLTLHSKFFCVSTLQPFTWCNKRPTIGTWSASPAIPCGPILVTATTEGNQPTAGYNAWQLAPRWVHAPANHRYVAGMQAIGPGDPESAALTPPIFSIPPDGLSSRLTALWKLWTVGVVPTESQVQTLITEDAIRPGLARRFNASLIGFALLHSPLDL